MSKISRFKAALSKMLAVFGNVSTDKGVLAWDGDEDLKAGDAVYIEDQDGERTPAPDGDYATSDAKTIVVVDGKVSEIKDPEAQVAPAPEEPQTEMGRVSTDKGELLWEGDEDLAAGKEVYIEGEEGRVPAPDGEYATEDGKVIVVVEGKVSEIQDPDAEVAARKSAFARVKTAFEESFDEKMKAIIAAIIALRGDDADWYLYTAGENFAVVSVWGEDGDHYFRYNITWNEDGTAHAEGGEEVKMMFVPVDYKDPFAEGGEVDELRKDNAELRSQVEVITRKMEEMSRTPVAKPAHAEVKASAETGKTGNKGLDRLARYVDAGK